MTIMPLERVNISDNYGWRTHPISGTRRHHNGLDFAAASGTPLLAIAKMRLVSKGSSLGSNGAGHWATWELVDEPIVQFSYWHQLEAIPYAIGTVKAEGERVGTVGSTGASTGPHLHLEMYHAGALRDPWPWLFAATATPKPTPAPEVIATQEELMWTVEVPELGRTYIVTPNGVRWTASGGAIFGINRMTNKKTVIVPFNEFYPMWEEINALNKDDTALAGNDDIKALADKLGLKIPA